MHTFNILSPPLLLVPGPEPWWCVGVGAPQLHHPLQGGRHTQHTATHCCPHQWRLQQQQWQQWRRRRQQQQQQQEGSTASVAVRCACCLWWLTWCLAVQDGSGG